ncbi:MAG: hypothetical protein H7A21_06995 [Spirochaetales bacterium]|nr:hypothetical protein [Leptospiraceae bacterium]MCP5481159.1 hypothetical protein [Spirochaetales bacterium]MCP5486985.1 hypothetical protein [Spirochaetales bacterium]
MKTKYIAVFGIFAVAVGVSVPWLLDRWRVHELLNFMETYAATWKPAQAFSFDAQSDALRIVYGDRLAAEDANCMRAEDDFFLRCAGRTDCAPRLIWQNPFGETCNSLPYIPTDGENCTERLIDAISVRYDTLDWLSSLEEVRAADRKLVVAQSFTEAAPVHYSRISGDRLLVTGERGGPALFLMDPEGWLLTVVLAPDVDPIECAGKFRLERN